MLMLQKQLFHMCIAGHYYQHTLLLFIDRIIRTHTRVSVVFFIVCFVIALYSWVQDPNPVTILWLTYFDD